MARMNVAPTKMSIYNDHGKASKDILPHTNKEGNYGIIRIPCIASYSYIWKEEKISMLINVRFILQNRFMQNITVAPTNALPSLSFAQQALWPSQMQGHQYS